jgi:hypothetical protein
MLLENLADPAHIPFAHHGLQGTRADAIPVNMTVPEHVAGRVISGEHSAALEVPALRGFKVEWGDRTYKKLRSGVEEYRAPFVISYKATFQGGNPWSLCVLCVPTRPGWSRLILFQGNDLGVSHGRGTLDPAAGSWPEFARLPVCMLRFDGSSDPHLTCHCHRMHKHLDGSSSPERMRCLCMRLG